MYIGELILKYRNSFIPKMSQRAFAKRTSLSASYINTLEKVFNPKTGKPYSVTIEATTEIAKAMNLSVDELLKQLELNQEFIINSSEKSTTPYTQVLVYGTIPAGIPMECIEDIIDTEEISTDMLSGGKQYFGLKIKGNSMSPTYLDGDTIIFLKQDDCESGDDCVVMVNGNEGTFKRVIKDVKNKTITLQPLNTSLDSEGKPLYPPITFTNEQIENLPVRIIGVFDELRRRNKRKK